jgi:hypothetical protein
LRWASRIVSEAKAWGVSAVEAVARMVATYVASTAFSVAETGEVV